MNLLIGQRYDISQNRLMFEKQATVSMLQHAVVLHGEPVMNKWRQQVAEYPKGLAWQWYKIIYSLRHLVAVKCYRAQRNSTVV